MALTATSTLAAKPTSRGAGRRVIRNPVWVRVVFMTIALLFVACFLVLPLAAVTMGVVWTVGAMVLAGNAINLGTLVLPPLLMAIGIAYAIPIISRYYQEREPGRARSEVVQLTMDDLGLPALVAALTTVIVFARLALSRIPAIRDFGV